MTFEFLEIETEHPEKKPSHPLHHTCIIMSTTMRTTLQTVPESLPADHVTNASGNTASTTTAPIEAKPHLHTNSATAALKTRLDTRSSSTKVSFLFFLLFFYRFIHFIFVYWFWGYVRPAATVKPNNNTVFFCLPNRQSNRIGLRCYSLCFIISLSFYILSVLGIQIQRRPKRECF